MNTSDRLTFASAAVNDGDLGRREGPALFIYAHPDDETFSSGGTMAALVSLGVPVTLISATRGEAGKTGLAEIDDPDVLGAVREQELRAAGAALGVVDVRFLDYRDSGMAGTPENDDPRALHQASEALVATKLVAHLRAVRPRIVATFGPDGIYGHPDHLVVHRAATEAVARAADPAFRPAMGEPWRIDHLYYSSPPREEFLKMLDEPNGPLAEIGPEERKRFGTPSADLTTWIDVEPWFEAKRRAILAHRTQTGDGGPMSNRSSDDDRRRFARETYIHVRLPWQSEEDAADDRLARLVAEAAGAGAQTEPLPVGAANQ